MSWAQRLSYNTTAGTADFNYRFPYPRNDSACAQTLTFDATTTAASTIVGDLWYGTTDTHIGNIDFNWRDVTLSKAGRIKNALMKIFEPIPKDVKKEMTEDDKKLVPDKLLLNAILSLSEEIRRPREDNL